MNQPPQADRQKTMCPKCTGRGKVYSADNRVFHIGNYDKTVCPRCKGLGYIYKDKPLIQIAGPNVPLKELMRR